jgi:hypothetical protein
VRPSEGGGGEAVVGVEPMLAVTSNASSDRPTR